MKNSETQKTFAWIGFFFTIFTGSLLHFAFELSGGSTLVGAFTPVNESIWEHLKLLVFPVGLFAVIEYFVYGHKSRSFTAAKILSIFVGCLLIIFLYYSYTSIFETESFIVDILIYIISVGVSYLLSYYLTTNELLSHRNSGIIAIVCFTALIILFIYFTFNPPINELFRDPITSDYGIPY